MRFIIDENTRRVHVELSQEEIDLLQQRAQVAGMTIRELLQQDLYRMADNATKVRN